MEQSLVTKIKSIVSCIETDNPNTDYSLITLLHDGPDGIMQVTLGDGFSEYGGDLKQCIQLYVDKNGKYSDQLKEYIPRIGQRPSLATNTIFINLLKESSKEDQLMRDAQDEVFDSLYWTPSLNWAIKEGFVPLPLSQLVIYDSYVQSGSIYTFLRDRFSASVPVNGGDEKTWIKAYSDTRLDWLSNHTNPAVRSSAYRMRTYEKLIAADNWNLDGSITTDNGCTVNS